MNLLSRILSCTFFFGVIVSCAPPSENAEALETIQSQPHGIKGGDRVQLSDTRFTSVVALLTLKKQQNGTDDFESICTGTLIAENIVLTAAHCIPRSANSQILVLSASNLENENEVRGVRRAVKTVIHPGYNPEKYKNMNDIALVHFEGDPIAGTSISPLMSSSEGASFKRRSDILIAGFGESKTVKEGQFGVLRWAREKVADSNFSNTEFTTRQFTKGICSGDSGGPAFYNVNGRQVVAGVISRGISIGPFNCIFTGYFSRVDKFEQWLQLEIAKIQGISLRKVKNKD